MKQGLAVKSFWTVTVTLTVVSSKMGEKQLWRQFAQVSGYEAYPVLKRARESQAKFIKMVGDEK